MCTPSVTTRPSADHPELSRDEQCALGLEVLFKQRQLLDPLQPYPRLVRYVIDRGLQQMVEVEAKQAAEPTPRADDELTKVFAPVHRRRIHDSCSRAIEVLLALRDAADDGGDVDELVQLEAAVLAQVHGAVSGVRALALVG